MKDETMQQVSPVVRQPGEGPRHNVLGATHLYKALAAETGGSLSVFEETIPPGVGAPPHTHSREDEAFYVVAGEMTFEIEGRDTPLQLGAGGFVLAPRGSRHAFRNESTVDAKMLVLALPGAGLEQMFGAFDEALRRADGGLPPEAEIMAIAARNGVSVEPPV
jgi:mannose-6-phosphate isomerase-like protein (cupin superfamily)